MKKEHLEGGKTRNKKLEKNLNEAELQVVVIPDALCLSPYVMEHNCLEKIVLMVSCLYLALSFDRLPSANGTKAESWCLL